MYTVWIQEDQRPQLPYPPKPFVYAGYSGRKLTPAKLEAKRAAGEKRKGLRDRLYNHAAGRRTSRPHATQEAAASLIRRTPDPAVERASGVHS